MHVMKWAVGQYPLKTCQSASFVQGTEDSAAVFARANNAIQSAVRVRKMGAGKDPSEHS